MHTSTAQSHARPHSHHHAGRSAAAAAPAVSAVKPKLYNPRHPERTLFYQTIGSEMLVSHILWAKQLHFHAVNRKCKLHFKNVPQAESLDLRLKNASQMKHKNLGKPWAARRTVKKSPLTKPV